MYSGLVKVEESWYDVKTARPAQWADWSQAGSDESYSDCAKLDIKTGQQNIFSFYKYHKAELELCYDLVN